MQVSAPDAWGQGPCLKLDKLREKESTKRCFAIHERNVRFARKPNLLICFAIFLRAPGRQLQKITK